MIEKILIISLIVFAIHYTMQEGEIFGFIGTWLFKVLPEALHNPVFECVICMAGVYGAALYWLIWGEAAKEWLIVNIAAIGLNAVIVRLSRKTEDPEEIKIQYGR